MEREFIVEDLQPARVAAYSYYSPGKMIKWWINEVIMFSESNIVKLYFVIK